MSYDLTFLRTKDFAALPPETLLQHLDLIAMVRDELAPRRFFFRKRDICMVAFDALVPLLGLAQPSDGPVFHHVFRGARPAKLVEFFRAQQPHQGKLDRLSADTVLTRETVNEAKATLPDLKKL